MTTPSTGVMYPAVTVQLTGEDGNAFAIIGRIQRALRQQVSDEVSQQWVRDALNCQSYQELLALAQRTVHVS